MLKMNLKIRLKNKTFVVSMLTAIMAFIYQMLSLFEVVSPISQEQIIQFIMIFINILVGLGILVDPTTQGVGDSERVLNKKDE